MDKLKSEFWELFIHDEECSFVKSELMLDSYIQWTKEKIINYVKDYLHKYQIKLIEDLQLENVPKIMQIKRDLINDIRKGTL